MHDSSDFDINISVKETLGNQSLRKTFNAGQR